ncbi:hypothetical protein GWK47_007111 [Chionoecetes opilio]|uniref:Uncharacterized protein n=1 Tax=Chionoecetes opilio TaxID=41210 RepID=A0A8J4Y349_CHIOP|nr:hypothetical protein GWK47_007111 [Chionoecetes opilio]
MGRAPNGMLGHVVHDNTTCAGKQSHDLSLLTQHQPSKVLPSLLSCLSSARHSYHSEPLLPLPPTSLVLAYSYRSHSSISAPRFHPLLSHTSHTPFPLHHSSISNLTCPFVVNRPAHSHLSRLFFPQLAESLSRRVSTQAFSRTSASLLPSLGCTFVSLKRPPVGVAPSQVYEAYFHIPPGSFLHSSFHFYNLLLEFACFLSRLHFSYLHFPSRLMIPPQPTLLVLSFLSFFISLRHSITLAHTFCSGPNLLRLSPPPAYITIPSCTPFTCSSPPSQLLHTFATQANPAHSSGLSSPRGA